MIFLVKGYLPVENSNFAERLAEALNPAPPRWPIDDHIRRAWEEMLQGWEEADTSVFQARAIQVDHVIALVVFEHRNDYTPPPRFSDGASREAFERWRNTACLDVLDKRLPRVFQLLCDLVESVPHPVVTGSELGTSPQDSLLSRMLLFKHSRAPHLKILLRDRSYGPRTPTPLAPTAVVFERELPPDELLRMIRKRPDGGVDVDPALLPSPNAASS